MFGLLVVLPCYYCIPVHLVVGALGLRKIELEIKTRDIIVGDRIQKLKWEIVGDRIQKVKQCVNYL